jgi:hypothetical protein
VPQAAQIRIGLSKPDNGMPPTAGEFHIFALADDPKIPLQVGKRVE